MVPADLGVFSGRCHLRHFVRPREQGRWQRSGCGQCRSRAFLYRWESAKGEQRWQQCGVGGEANARQVFEMLHEAVSWLHHCCPCLRSLTHGQRKQREWIIWEKLDFEVSLLCHPAWHVPHIQTSSITHTLE